MSSEENVTTHLTDEELTHLLTGDADDGATAHAAACASCARELEALRSAIGQWRQALDREARTRSTAPLPARRRLAWPLLAAASVVAALLAGPVGPHRGTGPASPSPVAESDQALLASVESALDREVPEALAPATLLVEDLAAASPR